MCAIVESKKPRVGAYEETKINSDARQLVQRGGDRTIKTYPLVLRVLLARATEDCIGGHFGRTNPIYAMTSKEQLEFIEKMAAAQVSACAKAGQGKSQNEGRGLINGRSNGRQPMSDIAEPHGDIREVVF